ncbi:protein cortex-like [Anoplophora glabripennis]|uniref:protein cortex-like n=1 Tax=Anoplophora glabripennis TaxID=217634 RepID=UPI000875768C|nr:protein cortex-like [Anoplophora glabripennis]
MGSPLSSVLANIYMEAFEKKALESTTLKPKCWYRYVDDTFIIWPHGRNTVVDFLDHISGIHPDIQFTMELEKNAALPFLDVLVERKPDGTLGHRPRTVSFPAAPVSSTRSSPAIHCAAIAVMDSRRNTSDRFIPRRANVNFDLSYYSLTEDSDDFDTSNIMYSGSSTFTNTAKYYYNLAQYRTHLWKAMMPRDNKILVFSSPKKKGRCGREKNCNTSLWPIHPRSKPLLGRPSIILDMPDLDTDITHQVVDWGKKGYIGTIYENEVHLWHPDDNLSRLVTNTQRRVQACLKWNEDGTQFGMALSMSGIAVWDFNASKVLYSSLIIFLQMSESGSCLCLYGGCVVTAMQFTSNNYLITGCSSGRLCIWTPCMVCIRTLHTAHTDMPIIVIKLSCNENYLVTTGLDRKVRICKWPTLEGLFQISFTEAPVKAVAWHPWRDSLLAIGGPTNTALWNVSTLKELDSKTHPHENKIIDCLTFNPLSAELVASHYIYGSDGNDYHVLLVMKDLENVVDEVVFHEGRVPYLLWDATGTKLATASTDENLCIWDFFGPTEVEKRYLKLSQKKELSTDMLKNLNIFNSYIR